MREAIVLAILGLRVGLLRKVPQRAELITAPRLPDLDAVRVAPGEEEEAGLRRAGVSVAAAAAAAAVCALAIATTAAAGGGVDVAMEGVRSDERPALVAIVRVNRASGELARCAVLAATALDDDRLGRQAWTPAAAAAPPASITITTAPPRAIAAVSAVSAAPR